MCMDVSKYWLSEEGYMVINDKSTNWCIWATKEGDVKIASRCALNDCPVTYNNYPWCESSPSLQTKSFLTIYLVSPLFYALHCHLFQLFPLCLFVQWLLQYSYKSIFDIKKISLYLIYVNQSSSLFDGTCTLEQISQKKWMFCWDSCSCSNCDIFKTHSEVKQFFFYT